MTDATTPSPADPSPAQPAADLPGNKPPHLVTLVLMTGVSIMSLNLFVPSLLHIASDLSASYSVVALSLAGYLGITAVLQLVIGPLSDRFGRRPVMLVALSVFCLASVGCALATDITTFLVFRFLQAVVAAGTVISPAVVRDLYPANEAASRLGYVSMAMAIAPMMGPMIGGLLDEAFGWRASFVFLAGFGAMVLLLCWFDLHETRRGASRSMLEQWRNYPAVLGSRRFWGYALCSTLSIGAFYIFITGAPLVARSVLDISPAWLGVYIGSISSGFLVGSFLSGRFASAVGIDRMILLGRLTACTGLGVGLIVCMAGYVSVASVFGATLFVGLGNGLTTPSSHAGALSVRPEVAGSAAGLSGALTVAVGGALTMAAGTLVQGPAAAQWLLAMMLAVSAAALVAARIAAARSAVPAD